MDGVIIAYLDQQEMWSFYPNHKKRIEPVHDQTNGLAQFIWDSAEEGIAAIQNEEDDFTDDRVLVLKVDAVYAKKHTWGKIE